MFCEIALLSENFAAVVALETPLPSVCYHVALQVGRRSTSLVALVTLVSLFFCVLTHHVSLQLSCCNARKLTHCASVRLFPRVGPFVLLQIA